MADLKIRDYRRETDSSRDNTEDRIEDSPLIALMKRLKEETPEREEYTREQITAIIPREKMPAFYKTAAETQKKTIPRLSQEDKDTLADKIKESLELPANSKVKHIGTKEKATFGFTLNRHYSLSSPPVIDIGTGNVHFEIKNDNNEEVTTSYLSFEHCYEK